MNDFKFTLISTFIFMVIIGLGVLAFYALEPGDRNGSRQVVSALEIELAEKEEALQEMLRRVAELESDKEQLVATSDDEEDEKKDDDSVTSETDSSSSDSELVLSLKSLRSKGVLLEPGDSGSNVGTIQKFLNAYEGKTGGVDNDFGPTTRKRVESFQKAEGLTVDGGVGSGTFSKMISWLEKNE